MTKDVKIAFTATINVLAPHATDGDIQNTVHQMVENALRPLPASMFKIDLKSLVVQLEKEKEPDGRGW